MANFGRTARQSEIWNEFDAIRVIVDMGLLCPDDGCYSERCPEDEGELQEEWDELVEEYVEIHTENGTFG